MTLFSPDRWLHYTIRMPIDGKERVLEICYTDLKHTYQIKLDDKGSEVLTDQSLAATTRIDTPFTVWSAIS